MQTNFFSGASKALRMPNFCGSGHNCAVPSEPPAIPPNFHSTKVHSMGVQAGDVFKSSGSKA